MEQDETMITKPAEEKTRIDIGLPIEERKGIIVSGVSADQSRMDSVDDSRSTESSCNGAKANHQPIQMTCATQEFKEGSSQQDTEGDKKSVAVAIVRGDGCDGGDVGNVVVKSPGDTTECLPQPGGESLSTHSSPEVQKSVAATKGGADNEEQKNKSPTTGGSESYDDLRKALMGFYSVHNPGRIATLDAILTQYRGKEDILIERLEQKYSADLSYARRAVGKTTTYAIPEVAGASRVMDRTSTRPELPSQALLVPPQGTRARQPVTDDSHIPCPGSAEGGGASALALGKDHLQSARSTLGNSSASYMTYLADQIRSNVEGFLPGSGGGAVPSSTGPPLAPAAVSPSPASVRWQRRDPRAIFPSTSPGTGSSVDGTSMKHRTMDGRTGIPAGGSNDEIGTTRNVIPQRHITSAAGNTQSSVSSSIREEVEVPKGSTQKFTESSVESAVSAERERSDAALARVTLLEEERVQLLARCKRLQGKAEAASREAAAAEELREAGQRKITAFAERAAAAERQAREIAMRLRVLESGQVTLQAEKEAFGRRCAAKHKQLTSAIDLQIALRSQLEALLGLPPISSALVTQAATTVTASCRSSEPAAGTRVNAAGCDASTTRGTSEVCVTSASSEWDSGAQGAAKDTDIGVDIGVDSGDGDESGGGGVDDLKRRCSTLEICLKSSRRECFDAIRTRDAAEDTVREQRFALSALRAKVSELEANIFQEAQAGKEAAQAAHALEGELALQLSHLREAEAKLCDQMEENGRLREELRGAAARLRTASDARTALLRFCRQERSAVELEAAQHVTQVEENAVMRGEEGLARGLELARMAEEAGEKRTAAATEETDRLGKALFTARAELAGSEAREQALRTELVRAAETIATLSSNAALQSKEEEMERAPTGTDAEHGGEDARDHRASGSRMGPRSRVPIDSSKASPGPRRRSRGIMRAAPKEAEVETSTIVASPRRSLREALPSDGQRGYDVEL